MNIPPRPGILIRAPDREKKLDPPVMDSSQVGKNHPNVLKTIGSSSSGNHSLFTVYVDTRRCPFSQPLLDVIDSKHLSYKKIDICFDTFPKWLPGTPSLLCEGNVFCGDAAYKFVESIPTQDAELLTDSKATVQQGFPKPSRPGNSASGCGLSTAFAAPRIIEEDESKYNMSTDDMMQKLLANRR